MFVISNFTGAFWDADRQTTTWDLSEATQYGSLDAAYADAPRSWGHRTRILSADTARERFPRS